MKKLTTEQFIKNAREIHGDIYDYSKSVYINSTTPVKIICPEHGVFEKKPNKHISSKQGCPKCSDKKLTTEIFIKNAKEIHGNKYDYSKVIYKDNKTKVKIICPEHGEFEKNYLNHVTNKQGCPKCSWEKISIETTLSQEVIINRFKEIYGDKYDYSKVIYKGINEPVTIICKNYGEFTQTPNNHLKGYGNPKERGRVNDQETFLEKSKDIFGDRFDYTKFIYNGIFTKATLTCKKHNHTFEVTPNTHLYSKHGGCSECVSEEKRVTFEEFLERSSRLHKNFYSYDNIQREDYDGITRTKVKIECPVHGIFNQSIFDHYVMGNGCPKCGNKKSRLEDFIEEFLIKYGVKYEQHKLGLISPYEIDFYLPEYNIAIEVNGLRYHSEYNGNKKRSYHLNKTKLCLEQGVKLIHIFEDEIVHKPNIVINKLRSLLNLKKIKIHGRKCEVREISSELKTKFLDKYHLQGDDNSSIKLGLFYRNKLISVMTFGHIQGESNKIMNESGRYDLKRYCGISSAYVIGGAGKLLKYFERNYKPKYIISYADKRWSTGDLYFNLNFNHIRDNSPNYRVTTGRYPYITYHKKLFQKDKLEKKLENYDSNLSEWANLKNNGWDRIWDCGLMVFVKKYP
jgi:very-short-patch-repair endonuclease